MRKYVKSLARLLPSAVTFFAGVGSLFIADMVISRQGSEAVIAEWATLRSFMAVAGVFALCGLEQLVIREPKAARRILKVLIPQIIIVGSIAACVGYYFGFTRSILYGAIVAIGFAGSNLAFQWLRSNLEMTRAYIANGSWRVLFLISLVVLFMRGFEDINLLLAGAFVAGGLIVLTLVAVTKARDDLVAIHSDIHSIKDMYGLGITYFFAALSLAIASYGENLVVHQLGTTSDVATYFQAAVTFLFPGVVLNQYCAAIAGPMVRQNESRILGLLQKSKWLILAAIGMFLPSLYFGGRLLEMILYGEAVAPTTLAILLVVTACVRLLYIIPSAFVGVTANKTELKWMTLAYLGCALLLPILSYIFVKSGFVVIFSVAVANLINWALRCFVGAGLVRKRYKFHFGVKP